MIVNRQRSVRIPAKDLGKFLVRARRALHLPSESVSICLVSNSEMARWNRAYRGKRGTTDVLSFRVDDAETKRALFAANGNSTRYLGDIAIAPAVARRNALRYGRSFSREMRVLILHGMLHLMGYDHDTDTGQMERRERRLHRALGLT